MSFHFFEITNELVRVLFTGAGLVSLPADPRIDLI